MHPQLAPLLLLALLFALSCTPEPTPASPEPPLPPMPAASQPVPTQTPEPAAPNVDKSTPGTLPSAGTSVGDPSDLVIACMKEVGEHLQGLPGDLRLEAMATQTVPCFLPKEPLIERYALHQQHSYNAFTLAPGHCYLKTVEALLLHFQTLASSTDVVGQQKWTQTSFETECPSARNVLFHSLKLATTLYADMGAFDLASALCRRGDKETIPSCLSALEKQWRQLPEASTLAPLKPFPVPTWKGGETVVRLPMVLTLQDDTVTFDGRPVCQGTELTSGACKAPLKKQLEKKTRVAMVMYQEKELKRIPALAVVAGNLDDLRELVGSLPKERVPTFAMARGKTFPEVVQFALDGL